MIKQSKTQPVLQPNNLKRKQKLNIMIDQVLPRACNPQLWSVIRSVPCNEWLSTQRDIMNILISDSKLFQSFFKRFYLNHLQLHNWYMLARENQLQLKKYVFTHLLSKSYRQYREMVKEEQTRNKFGKMNEVLREDEGKDKKKDSFHKIHLGNLKTEGKMTTTFNPVCDQQKQRRKQVQFQATLQQFSREDYHQLFLKTFNACDGNKYIYYDFDKHMRGVEQQKNYNSYIRFKKHTRMHNSLTLKEEEQLTLNKTTGKENSQSTYVTDLQYFHEGEDKLEKMVYCNYNWNPIGSLDVGIHKRQQYVLKRLPNVFKKVKHCQSSKGFLLRRKKVL